jgi:hypothetical protein
MVENLSHLAFARGHFEHMKSDKGALLVSGWMMLPDRDLTQFQLYRNGELVAGAEPKTREDVGRAFPWIPHARRSGFQFKVPVTEHTGWIEVVGLRDRRPVARLRSMFRTDLDRAVPSPPTQVVVGVAGNASIEFFKADGLKSFSDFFDAVNRHGGLGWVRRMLD